MNENTEFDLEWAKRGGAVYDEVTKKYYKYIRYGDAEFDVYACITDCSIDQPIKAVDLPRIRLRMAARVKFLFENANLAYLKATSSDSMDKFIEDIDAAMKGGA